MKIDVDDSAVRAAFRRMLAKGADPASYLPAIGSLIVESTRLRFTQSQSPEGATWAPVRRGGQPLRNTGTHLMNALSYRVEGASVVVGVPYAWASVHQWGETITAKNAKYLAFKIGKQWVRKFSVKIPARPFLGVSLSDRTDIIETLRRQLLPA